LRRPGLGTVTPSGPSESPFWPQPSAGPIEPRGIGPAPAAAPVEVTALRVLRCRVSRGRTSRGLRSPAPPLSMRSFPLRSRVLERGALDGPSLAAAWEVSGARRALPPPRRRPRGPELRGSGSSPARCSDRTSGTRAHPERRRSKRRLRLGRAPPDRSSRHLLQFRPTQRSKSRSMLRRVPGGRSSLAWTGTVVSQPPGHRTRTCEPFCRTDRQPSFRYAEEPPCR
jgi:hypothetical protein